MTQLNKYFIIAISLSLFFSFGCKKEAAKTLKPEIALAKPIRVLAIQLQPFASTRKIVGSTYAIEDLIISCQTAPGGIIENVRVELGQAVSSGETLAIVDQESAKAQLLSASSNYQLALTNFKMQESLYASKAISEQQYKSFKTQVAVAQSGFALAKLQYENTSIKSPINGVITDQFAHQGEYISIGKPIFRVINRSVIKVKFGISEEELKFIKKNMYISIDFPNISGKSHQGIISSIGEIADNGAKTFPIEVKVTNSDLRIKPGMLCSIRLIKNRFDHIAVIPQDSILEEGIKSVFVVSNNIVHKKKIEIIGLEEDKAAVRGVEPGDQLVIIGQKTLNEGEKVKVIN